MRKTVTITIALPTELLESIDRVAKQEDLTRSQIVRRAIRSSCPIELSEKQAAEPQQKAA